MLHSISSFATSSLELYLAEEAGRGRVLQVGEDHELHYPGKYKLNHSCGITSILRLTLQEYHGGIPGRFSRPHLPLDGG